MRRRLPWLWLVLVALLFPISAFAQGQIRGPLRSPAVDGTNGQCLQTDGAGHLSWGSCGGGGGGIGGSIADTQIAFGVGTDVGGSSLLRYWHQDLVQPSPPVSVTPVGTAGMTTWKYAVLAVNATKSLGLSAASTSVTTVTGNAVLDNTNKNRIVLPTCGAEPAGTQLVIWRFPDGGGDPNGDVGPGQLVDAMSNPMPQACGSTFDDVGYLGDYGNTVDNYQPQDFSTATGFTFLVPAVAGAPVFTTYDDNQFVWGLLPYPDTQGVKVSSDSGQFQLQGLNLLIKQHGQVKIFLQDVETSGHSWEFGSTLAGGTTSAIYAYDATADRLPIEWAAGIIAIQPTATLCWTPSGNYADVTTLNAASCLSQTSTGVRVSGSVTATDFIPTGVAFASLPGSPVVAEIALVTDSTVTTGTVSAGSGAHANLVIWTGALWTVFKNLT